MSWFSGSWNRNKSYVRQSSPSGKGKGSRNSWSANHHTAGGRQVQTGHAPVNKTYVRPQSNGAPPNNQAGAEPKTVARWSAVRADSGKGSHSGGAGKGKGHGAGKGFKGLSSRGSSSVKGKAAGRKGTGRGKGSTASQPAQTMFLKLLAQKRRGSSSSVGFSKSSRGNQLIRVPSSIGAARSTGIQKAGKRSLQWVRHETLRAHAETVNDLAKKKAEKAVLDVAGTRFKLSQGGKALVRIRTTAPDKPAVQPSRVLIGGATFISQGGDLVQSTSQKSVKQKKRSTKRSLRVVRSKKQKANKSLQPICMFFTKYGKCSKGDQCEFAHDSAKVAVCSKFLQGKCSLGADCLLSHQVSEDKMPVCYHFLTSICTNDNCPYLHVKVSEKASVCKAFLKGYCPLGAQCPNKHMLTCEAFLKGKCPRGDKCHLHHPKCKGVKRKHVPPDSPPHADKRIKPVVARQGSAPVAWPTQSSVLVKRTE